MDIMWELVSPKQLTFTWTPSATNCSNIHYNIFAVVAAPMPPSTPLSLVLIYQQMIMYVCLKLTDCCQ